MDVADDRNEDQNAAGLDEGLPLFSDLPESGEPEAPAEAEPADGEGGDETVAPDEPVETEVPDAPAETVEEPAAPAAPAAAPTAEELSEQHRRKGMRWFVIHANTGHENKVKRNIETAIKANHMEDSFGEILVATQEVTEMKAGRRYTVKRKFFPSYILVEMVMTKDTQHFINSIPGVTRFIGGTQLKPEPITREEVDRILGRMSKAEEAGAVMDIPYQVGDSVQVIDGPFSDWVGVIDEINRDKGKLKVMISIFGSETPVELDFLQVKSV